MSGFLFYNDYYRPSNDYHVFGPYISVSSRNISSNPIRPADISHMKNFPSPFNMRQITFFQWASKLCVRKYWQRRSEQAVNVHGWGYVPTCRLINRIVPDIKQWRSQLRRIQLRSPTEVRRLCKSRLTNQSVHGKIPGKCHFARNRLIDHATYQYLPI